MKYPKKIACALGLLAALAGAPALADTVQFSGTIYKMTSGTTFDVWRFDVQAAGTFTVDLAAYEASQSNVATAGYYTADINGDGKLTWLDPDTYFYRDTGQPLLATDAIVRCDDTQNNCPVYQNGLTALTSPVRITTHLQSETPVDGTIHFRRDPWFDVDIDAGSYLYLIADYLLTPAEAQGGINTNDSFSPPTGFVDPITDHATYRVTLSSPTLQFAVNGNTITISAVPVPAALWLFGSALAGLGVLRRRCPTGA